MTGYQSKKTAALDEEGMYLVHQTAQRPWVDLTEDQIKNIEEKALTKQWAIRMALAAVKECNA